MAENVHPIPPYGTAIQDAIAQGDISKMKKIAQEAEAFIKQHGDLRSALAALHVEIAKAEHKK
jgi:Domain of unknown function (DUF1843)